MRMHSYLLIGYLASALFGASCSRKPWLPKHVSWDKETGAFAWGGNEIRLPVGFTYQADPGADSFEGHFTAPDGRLTIRHDIGGNAGSSAKVKDASSFQELLVQGARVWIARSPRLDEKGAPSTLVAVTFPDSGCANFFVLSSKAKDAELMYHVAQSYRPRLPHRPKAETSRGCQK